MSRFKYLLVGATSGIIGLTVGINLAVYLEKPHTVYEKKIEGDPREFLVIESKARRVPMVRNYPARPFETLDRISEGKLNAQKMYQKSLKREVLSEK